MPKNASCMICILALLAALLPVVAEDYQNTSQNSDLNNTKNLTKSLTLTQNLTQNATENASQTTKVLRVGFEKTKAVNDLDVYGSKALHSIEAYPQAKSTFNVSQRMGMVGKISYNTDIYKPIYNLSEYSRTKPTYEVPGSLSSRSVYNIAGYPQIKVPSSIP